MKKLLYLALALILTACGASSPEATITTDPMDVNKEQIYYNPIDRKLVKFNPNGNQSEVINADDTSYAYDIENADNIFVVGDSLEHTYKLIEIEGTDITTIHDFNQGEEIYPIGYNADNIYFIHSFYENGVENKEKRTISFYNLTDKTVDSIGTVTGLISDGVVSPNNIYYTVFNNEFNYHELHRKSIEIGKKSEAPELISVGYESQELYLSKDLRDEKEIISLYASDQNRIYSKDDNWPKFQANYFRPTSMIGIDRAPDNTMKITFIDKRSREVANEVEGVVGIRSEGDTLVVATTYGASKY